MDVQAALKDGYTKDQVMEELGKRTGMNFQQAIKDGHSPDDVFTELVKRDSKGEGPDKRTTLQKVASTVAPYAPAALAVTGGIVGTPIVGGALGYLAGTEVEKRLQEYAGERQAPKGIGEAFKETGSQFIQKGTVPFTDIPSYRSPVAEALS